MRTSMTIRDGALAVIAAMAILAAPASVSAQAAAPATLPSATFSGAAAKRAKTTTEINLETAERIVDACIEYARARNSGASVVVLSASGYTVVAKRTDGQTPNNIDSAYQKARTALYMRASTQEVANRWGSAEAQLARANLDLYLVVGGLPIIVEDQLIGSIGVGGASADEPCAYEALSKVLGQPPPPAGAPAVPASPAR